MNLIIGWLVGWSFAYIICALICPRIIKSFYHQKMNVYVSTWFLFLMGVTMLLSVLYNITILIVIHGVLQSFACVAYFVGAIELDVERYVDVKNAQLIMSFMDLIASGCLFSLLF